MLEEQVECGIIGIMSETPILSSVTILSHMSPPDYLKQSVNSGVPLIFTKRNHPSYIFCFIYRFILKLYFDQPFLTYPLYSSSVNSIAIHSILKKASP
jgi:hypothetical protein